MGTRMSLLPGLALGLAILLVGQVAGADDLSGRWEMQSLGADRELTLRQRGSRLEAYRLMWPEFEGKRYKLEHLYRGKISGGQIKGKLWVKEEELPKFEVLRRFTGSIRSAGSIILDDIPLRRLDQSQLAATDPAAVISTVSMVSNRSALGEEASRLTRQGDRLFKEKRYCQALRVYERAAGADRQMNASLVHRMGRCHLRLGDHSRARAMLRRAVKLDPNNRELLDDYRESRAGGASVRPVECP